MNDPVVAESKPDDDRAGEQRVPADPTPLRRPENWTVLYAPETGSTNTDLLKLARQGAADRTALRTDHQTDGRGRLDRRWASPPGANLMVSLLFRPAEQGDPNELVRRVGVAAVQAVRTTTRRMATLKWPNDLMLDGRKLAGILAQRDASNGAVVVGLGLNTSWAPDGAIELGGAVNPADLLDAILAAVEALPNDDGAFHNLYRAYLGTLGQSVRVELPSSEILGRATDVDRTGRLVVIDGCAISHLISVGDVVHLRPG